MLVFASDIHLTDGDPQRTINPKAFEVFTHHLEYLAGKAKAKNVTVVFLGDILDVIRSEVWLDTDVRPWSDPTHTDGKGHDLEYYTREIVTRICTQACNKQASGHLRKFKQSMKKARVRYHYIIGNHDWLINRYPETRQMAAEFLHLDKPSQYLRPTKRLPLEGRWRPYKAFARHGDIYDPLNFDGNRDSSSLGDAVVIDLLSRFPQEVAASIGRNNNRRLIAALEEIDNVRPLVDIPKWVQGACLRARNKAIGAKVRRIWNKLADRFLDIPFVQDHDTAWPFDVVDKLQMALKISKLVSLASIAQLQLGKLADDGDNYMSRAYQEDCIRDRTAQFVIYGHSHKHMTQPLDNITVGRRLLHQIYFNTGTWRRVHRRTAYDVKNLEFASWDVMTFVAIYLKSERWARPFEVWNGSLG